MGRRVGLGQAEAELLRYIQENTPVRVRTAAEHFATLQRTTILNMMERLRAKGFLTREQRAGIWHYSPTVAAPTQKRHLVREFVQQMLGGEVSPFVAYLTEEAELTQDQLDELKRIVAELEVRKP